MYKSGQEAGRNEFKHVSLTLVKSSQSATVNLLGDPVYIPLYYYDQFTESFIQYPETVYWPGSQLNYTIYSFETTDKYYEKISSDSGGGEIIYPEEPYNPGSGSGESGTGGSGSGSDEPIYEEGH